MSDKPPVFWEDGRWVVRASAAGMSVKSLAALMQGYETAPVSDRLKDIWALGHELEPALLAAVAEELGDEVTGQQQEVRLPLPLGLAAPQVDIVGHIDGLCDRYVVEVKGFGPDLYRQFVRGPIDFLRKHRTYRDQIAVYSAAMRRPVFYLVGLKDPDAPGRLLETHAAMIHPQEDFPEAIPQLCGRVVTALQHVEDGTLPVACNCDGWSCVTWHLHEDPDRVALDDVGLDDLLATYDRAAEAEKTAAADKRFALDAIQELLVAQGLDKVDTATHRVTRYTVTRRTLDKDALERTVGDLAPYYVEKASDGVKVTRRQGATT